MFSLLFSKEILGTMYKELSLAKESVQIITAYCKINVLDELSAWISNAVASKRLLVRFRLNDIVSGSTDFSILEYCLSHDWEIFIRFDLHAKTYIVDNSRALVGSANATASGLGLKDNANYEIATFVNLSEEDIIKVNRLFSDSVRVTPSVLSLLKKQYENVDKNNTNEKSLLWNKSILNLFQSEVSTLFSYELPDMKNIPSVDSFIPFLDISANIGIKKLKEAFCWSNCYRWLISILKKNDGSMFFGHLTAELHEALVEDPKPYRKDVKTLLANLLSWVQDLQMEEIVIDVPNHSQRVRLASCIARGD